MRHSCWEGAPSRSLSLCLGCWLDSITSPITCPWGHGLAGNWALRAEMVLGEEQLHPGGGATAHLGPAWKESGVQPLTSLSLPADPTGDIAAQTSLEPRARGWKVWSVQPRPWGQRAGWRRVQDVAGLMDDGWPPAPLQHLSQDLPPTRLCASQARLGAPGAPTAPALCHLHAV